MSIIFTARAKAFTCQGVRSHDFMIDHDDEVRVWDDIAGTYTLCHSMNERQLRRIRRLALEEFKQ